MKKLLAFILSLSIIVSVNTIANLSKVSAEESTETPVTYVQNENDNLPDTTAPHSRAVIDDFEFNVYDDFAVLTAYNNRDAEEVTIPSEVKGVPVVMVENTPFGKCRNLKTITLPDTLRYFNWGDLVCTTLETVNGSSSGSNNIYAAANTTITDLDEIKVKEQEYLVPSVSSVVVSETNPYYTSADGIIYSKDMKTLVGCPPALDITELNVSEKAECIGDNAFYDCYNLEKAVVPSNIKNIGRQAFLGCINLKSAEIPESIKVLTCEMFGFCISLSEVAVKGDIETIERGVFYECSSLKDFSIPETVTAVGDSAFENCGCYENDNGIYYMGKWVVGSDEDVENAIVKDGTIGISYAAFAFRGNIKILDIPKSVKYTGELMYIFGLNTSSLSEIHYRAHVIKEKTLAGARCSSDVYIYDPECEIYDSEKTILAQSRLKNPEYHEEYIFDGESSEETEKYITADIIIHGYENSTAQAYAEKYDRKFELIEDTVLKGDANGDGEFGIADAVILSKWILSDAQTDIKSWKSADLNNDNQLDAIDLCIMKNMILNG